MILVGVVTDDVVIGFVVLQISVVLQLLDPAGIVQFVAVRVPEGHGIVVNVKELAVYTVPVEFIAYPR